MTKKEVTKLADILAKRIAREADNLERYIPIKRK